MAVDPTFKNVTLSLTCGTVETGCRLVNPSMVRPFYGQGDTETTACGDQVSMGPNDSITEGKISGDVVADYTDTTGITVFLDDNLDVEIDVVWEETVESSGSGMRTRTWTGKGFVGPITRTFTHGKTTMHDLNLALVSEESLVYADAV